MKYIYQISILLLFSVAVFAQSTPEVNKRVEETKKQLEPVKAYVDGIKAMVEKNEEPDLVFADVSDYNSDAEAKWVKFENVGALNKDTREIYSIALLWKKDGKIAQANFTFSSPSGDWAQFVSHTYHPNGQLAYVDNELRTFMGDVIVNRMSYFSEDGIEISNSTTYRDLETQKPVKEPESFQDIEAEIYMKNTDFPFSAK